MAKQKRYMFLHVTGIRKIDRSVARHQMDLAGIRQKNKDKGAGSYFSKNWRDYRITNRLGGTPRHTRGPVLAK